MQDQGDGRSGFFLFFLVLTAFVCGAMVMVVEILGSRVIGPFFGVSLFVWTSLITVTLVALAAGYAAGGVVSDRWRHPDVLYGIILLAGVLVLFIPAVKGPVIRWALPLGLRGGALVSSLALFGPSLVLLGFVSPYLVKVAAREMENIGRTVGLLYSVSTIGSFVGTVVTGFVLITLLGVNRIFTIVGTVLVILAVIYFVVARRRWPVILALAIPLLPLQRTPVREFVMPTGTRVSVVHERDSYYGNLKVVDYDYGLYDTRELAIDGLVQGGVDLANSFSIYSYSYYLQFLPVGLHPGGDSCLVIGLGAGVVPRWYDREGIRTDVVDIDPAVVDIARTYFNFSVSGTVAVADARYFLLSTEKRYDYLILDVFTGDTTPAHLLSREALRLVHDHLDSGGVFAANIVGDLGEHSFMTASLIKTLGEVFETVQCYPTFVPSPAQRFGNLTLIAYDGPPRTIDQYAITGYPVHPLARESVNGLLRKPFAFPPGTQAIVLTDDYNPVDFYDSWVKETVRRGILGDTDFQVLL